MSTLEQFNFPVQSGVSSTTNANINEVVFDDGYSQRTKKGINNMLREFTCEFKGTYFNANGKMVLDENTLQVEAFLKRQQGYKAFSWTSFLYPNNKPVKVFCPKWGIKYNKGEVIISMSFKEVM